MLQDIMHRQIIERCGVVGKWFQAKTSSLDFPFSSSYDIRDAGFKVANVDANIFPAGFNNICIEDQQAAVEKVDNYITRNYGTSIRRILLLAEEHTGNPYYWDNIATIREMIQSTGREVVVALPRLQGEALNVVSHSKGTLQAFPAFRDGTGVRIGDFVPDLIVCNNDFSQPHEEWTRGLTTPMSPSYELGWYRRRKDAYFQFYNQICGEFADLLGIDPWLLQVNTRKFEHFDVSDAASVARLADSVEEMLALLRREYLKHGVDAEPFVFVKNNSGTYGLAVIQVRSGAAVLDWNYKSRKKMKAAKGGRDVEEVIIQEGIPTVLKYEASVAEPTIYMVGSELAGGFLRTHGEKGPDESLNSPGAVYKKLCMADLKDNSAQCPMENVYGWVARLSALAVAMEAQSMGVRRH